MEKVKLKHKNSSLVKRFIPYYKPYIGIFVLDLVCALGVALSGLVFPMLVRYILNVCLAAETVLWRPIIIVAAMMLGVRVLELLCNYYMTTVGHVMGSKVEANMRRDLYVKLLSLSASFYDDRQVGDLMSRVNNDLFEITEFSHHCPEEIFLAVVRLAGVFIYLSMINIWLTLILFALLPPLAIFAIVSNKKMSKAFRAQRKTISDINAHLQDSLSGMSVVRSFANEDAETEKFEKNNAEFIEVKRRSYRLMGIFNAGTLFSSGLMYVATVIFGVLFIHNNTLTTVDLIAFLLYVSTLMSTVQTIMAYMEQFQRGMSSFSRFVEIMDEPIMITSPENPVKNVNFESDIEFRDVTFRYNENGKDVLDRLSFTVKRGESLAIVGPSGAGKTTIAGLIPRFYDVVDGAITIGGTDVRNIDLKELRENVGIVQQNVYLFYGTVKENILYGRRDATDEEVIAAAKLAGAHDFITNLENGMIVMCYLITFCHL